MSQHEAKVLRKFCLCRVGDCANLVETMKFSSIGDQFNQRTGVHDLMDDLYEALNSGRANLCQLNGGAPAFFPEVSELWRKSMEDLMAGDGFDSLVGCYQGVRGYAPFIDALVNYLNKRYDWGLTAKNVAVTQGGQMAFFLLFNLLADDRSTQREVLFPICPDYVGYQAQSLVGTRLFRGARPQIHLVGEHEFKYGVDFSRLEIRPETAALCLSRPTNPTGNVITDEEVESLRCICREAGIPLLIDGAYGPPFPGLSFVPCNAVWDENIILSMSLSKIGLPGTRTGIVIANEEVISTIVNGVTISALCPNNLGQALVKPYLENGKLEEVCEDIVRPFYRERSALAQALLHEYLGDTVPWRLHKSEGAMFLWLWMEGLPISSQELYERCKKRGCFVNSGHHFFFALPPEDAEWRHQHECVRLSFTQSDEVLQCGLKILAEEVIKAFDEKR